MINPNLTSPRLMLFNISVFFFMDLMFWVFCRHSDMMPSFTIGESQLLCYFLEQQYPQMGAHNKFIVGLLEFMLNTFFFLFFTQISAERYLYGGTMCPVLCMPPPAYVSRPMHASTLAFGRRWWCSNPQCTSATVGCGWGTLMMSSLCGQVQRNNWWTLCTNLISTKETLGWPTHTMGRHYPSSIYN